MSSNVFSNRMNTDLVKLEQKLATIRPNVSDEEAREIEEKIKEIRDEIVDFDDDESAKKYEIIKKVVNLEMNFLSDERVKEIARKSTRNYILTQLVTLEEFITENREKVEEFLKSIDISWSEIKESYSDAEKKQVEDKITGIRIKCMLEKIKSDGKVDFKVVNNFCNTTGYYILMQMLTEKAETLSGFDKVTATSWINEIVDIKTGLIDEKKAKKIIKSSDFWRILSGQQALEPQKQEIKEEKQLQKADKNSRKQKIQEIAKKYSINPITLNAKKDEVVFFIEKVSPQGGYYDNTSSEVIKMKYEDFYNNKISPKVQRATVIVMGNNITKILPNSFSGMRNLRYIVLPEELSDISYSAFYYTGLREVEIPSKVSEIGVEAFSHCSFFRKIKLPEGLQRIDGMAFTESGLREIEIPGSVEEICGEAFCSCENLTQVTLHEGLKFIGEGAFYDTGIEEIDIPISVQDIGARAFAGCDKLKKVKSLKNIEQYVVSSETILQNPELKNQWLNNCENRSIER